jgi:hypothetical protein
MAKTITVEGITEKEVEDAARTGYMSFDRLLQLITQHERMSGEELIGAIIQDDGIKTKWRLK